MTALPGAFARAAHPARADAEGASATAAFLVPAAAPDPAANGPLPEDAVLYLRHVEKGETIRALAREAGCHASTILRRIRRFENKRDDPLIDGALSRAGAPRPANAAPLDRAQLVRILRRLAEPGAQMASADGMDKAIVTRDDIRTAILDRRHAEALALQGWVARTGPETGRIQRYVLAPQGRAALRAMLRQAGEHGGLPGGAGFEGAAPVPHPAPQGAAPHAVDAGAGLADAAAPFSHADQHRVYEARVITDPEDGRKRRTRVNIAESPLLLLARRREPDGSLYLTPGMVAAAERLREDFELAQMGARVTQNWDRFMTAGVDVSRQPGGYRGGSDSARDRVGRALRELGPGMGDVVLRVCCYLEGVEMTERRLGWSARSGKVVLRLALMRLERHYAEVYGKGSPLIG